ncbi:MAG: hypothetical protein RLZZ546_646, partial [Bacteroidota bacterium]
MKLILTLQTRYNFKSNYKVMANREWKRESLNYYSLWHHGIQVGSIEFINNLLEIDTTFSINQKTFHLRC